MINHRECDGQSLIHLINLLPQETLVGAEIGLWEAHTFCSLLECCPRIKTLYGVDPYQPYVDTIDGKSIVVDSDMIMVVKVRAITNIMSTGLQNKVLFVEDTSENSVDLIENNELDFIFVDSYINEKHALEELNRWYPKVKTGGIFSGHDYNSIKHVVDQFRKENNITNNMSVFDQTFVWIK
jgi:hypothetical protein